MPALTTAADPAVEAGCREEPARWYRVEIGGAPAGSMSEEVYAGEGGCVFETRLAIAVRRGPSDVAMELVSRLIEDGAGRLAEAEVEQRLGSVPVRTRFVFVDGGVEVESVQDGRLTARRVALPAGPWLTPSEIGRHVRAELAAGVERIRYRTFDPLVGHGLVELTLERAEGSEEIALGAAGEALAVTRWRQVQSSVAERPDASAPESAESAAAGGPEVLATVWLDAEGELVRGVTPLFGTEVVVTLAPASIAGEAVEPPEVLARTFVRPNRRLPAPRSLRRAVYRLSAGAERLPAPPSAAAQRVESRDDGGWTVTVDLDGVAGDPDGDVDGGPGRAEAAVVAPAERERYLAASAYLNHDDPKIRQLLASALDGREESAAERAERLRRFVYRFVDEVDLESGFATASEVARQASGDCTEHAVLLAALLRAAGIPSRVASGLLYVERFLGESEIFGFHMWTQALLDGRWVDLDPILEPPFDAAHIALETSALDEGSPFGSSGAGLHALEIEVLSLD